MTARASGFPHIPVWARSGAFEDGSHFKPDTCVGRLTPPADSVIARSRTITIRFLRDRVAEARPDFGGYRIWRAVNAPDTSRMVLIRRFSKNVSAPLTWNFSTVDTTTLQFICGGQVAHDSVVTVVDPDSSGNFVKVCRVVDHFGRCVSRGDSVLKLVPPPGPHDGFLTWYSVTYEALNVQDNVNLDLFVPGGPDTLENWVRCGTPGDTTTCPRINLNNKYANMIVAPVSPTAGPTENLRTVGVVPNPYRAAEAWDQPGSNELHFTGLPAQAVIKIYTVAGDLVATLDHDDAVHDFQPWNLKNQNGSDVASGIYMYRVESGTFTFQSRFVVVR
ncbi:MAG: T9SS type A sorting domain-containing protein [Candidatus Eiseniibacteriota bacterium]